VFARDSTSLRVRDAVNPPRPPGLVTWGIALIALALAALFVVAHRAAGMNLGLPHQVVRRKTIVAALAAAGWLSAFAMTAVTGVLARFELRPPPLLLALVGVICVTRSYSLSRGGKFLGSGLSLTVLVGFQVFRLPLELVMHEAALAGVMPQQMTFTGWNFDIVTGITAGVLAPLVALGRAPRWLILSWNVMGLVLVSVVMTIGFVSTPMLRVFGGGSALNTWIAYFPFVWLPAAMVAAAIAGHVLVFRRLAAGGG
jgi:hypothetical protein